MQADPTISNKIIWSDRNKNQTTPESETYENYKTESDYETYSSDPYDTYSDDTYSS